MAKTSFPKSDGGWLAIGIAIAVASTEARAERCTPANPACHLENGKQLLNSDPRRAAEELLASYQLDERTDTLALYATALQLDGRYALALETWKRVIVFRESELDAARQTARTASGRKLAAARAAATRAQKQTEQAAEAIIKLWPSVARVRIRFAAGQPLAVSHDGVEVDASRDVLVNAGHDELVFTRKDGSVEHVALEVSAGALAKIDAPADQVASAGPAKPQKPEPLKPAEAVAAATPVKQEPPTPVKPQKPGPAELAAAAKPGKPEPPRPVEVVASAKSGKPESPRPVEVVASAKSGKPEPPRPAEVVASAKSGKPEPPRPAEVVASAKPRKAEPPKPAEVVASAKPPRPELPAPARREAPRAEPTEPETREPAHASVRFVEEPRSPVLSHVGLGVAAGAVVAGGIAGTFGYLASRDYDRAGALGCANNQCPFGPAADLAQRSNDRARVAQITAVAGGALLATGVTLWIVGRGKTRHAVSDLALHVGPSSTAISGRF